MNYFLIVGVSLAVLIAVGFPVYYYLSLPKTVMCFSESNFLSALEYVKWKQYTSKIGKVLVNDYVVTLEENGAVIVFSNKEDWPIFKVTASQFIIMPIYHTKRVHRKSHNAFCALVNLAKRRGY
ncbi:MAG: hypothetical protein EAZ57_05750 [Cytophagales bacterium]|nr:MAG: hypothetical protein EAZ67_06655 [Cytophagales bacterium]TAF60856.1 MAG: hypothetical protein EAZ57_05750 [Cytophagales bacterium]